MVNKNKLHLASDLLILLRIKADFGLLISTPVSK